MKPSPPLYAQIPSRLSRKRNESCSPGAYCQGCGLVFATHHFSTPDGWDDNGKPFYSSCYLCDNKKEVADWE